MNTVVHKADVSLTKMQRELLHLQTKAMGSVLNSPEHERALTCLMYLAYGYGWADGWTDIDNIALNGRLSRVQTRSAFRALDTSGIARIALVSAEVFYFRFPVVSFHRQFHLSNWHLLDADSAHGMGVPAQALWQDREAI